MQACTNVSQRFGGKIETNEETRIKLTFLRVHPQNPGPTSKKIKIGPQKERVATSRNVVQRFESKMAFKISFVSLFLVFAALSVGSSAKSSQNDHHHADSSAFFIDGKSLLGAGKLKGRLKSRHGEFTIPVVALSLLWPQL